MKGLKILASMLNDAPDISFWSWATVTGISPLRVQLDGEDDPLAVTPDTLVAGLRVDDRVWVQLVTNANPARQYRRLVITGRAAGATRMGATVVRSTTQSAANGSNTVLSWSSATYDSDGLWSAGTNVTIPAGGDGIWAMTFHTEFASAVGSGRAYAAIEVTGGVIWRLPFAGSGEDHVTLSITAPLVAGNVLTAKVLQTSGGAINITASTFDCYRIGA